MNFTRSYTRTVLASQEPWWTFDYCEISLWIYITFVNVQTSGKYMVFAFHICITTKFLTSWWFKIYWVFCLGSSPNYAYHIVYLLFTSILWNIYFCIHFVCDITESNSILWKKINHSPFVIVTFGIDWNQIIPGILYIFTL